MTTHFCVREPRMRMTFALLVAVLALVNVSAVSAQSATATLSGVVTDETGAAVANVAIVLVHESTSSTRTGATDADGAFTLAGLVPGAYTLHGTRDSFAPVMVSPVIVNVND